MKEFRADNLAAGLVVAVGALSLNVLVGYAGQISLGHQAFIGIGSFTAGYVISQSHQSFYVALVAAVSQAKSGWVLPPEYQAGFLSLVNLVLRAVTNQGIARVLASSRPVLLLLETHVPEVH